VVPRLAIVVKESYEIVAAYTSTGVSMAWVKEQQMAPEKAYLATSDIDKPDLTGETTGNWLTSLSATCSTLSLLSGTLEMAGDADLGVEEKLRLRCVGISAEYAKVAWLQYACRYLNHLLMLKALTPKRPNMESAMPFFESGSTSFTTSLTASSTLRCSFLSSTNDSSSWMCHGYRTKTWKLSAEVATTKLVNGNRRLNIILESARPEALFYRSMFYRFS